MKLYGETIKYIRIRRHSLSFINFSFKSFIISINLNILKEKNLISSLFLCEILKKGNEFLSPIPNPFPQGKGLEFYLGLAFRPHSGLARPLILITNF
jgi:hypothetical protein